MYLWSDGFLLLLAVGSGSAAQLNVFHAHRPLCLDVNLPEATLPAIDFYERHPLFVALANAEGAFAVSHEGNARLIASRRLHFVAEGEAPLQGVELIFLARTLLIVLPIDVYGVLRIYLAAAHARIVADDVLVQASRYMKEAWALRLQGEGYAKGDEEEEFSHAGTVCFGGFLRLPPFAPCPRCGGSYRQAAAQERQNLLTKERVLAAKLPLFEDKPGKRQKKWSLFLHNQKLCRTFAVLLKTKPSNMVPIVQWVRASDCGSECRRFESDWAP